ncbi:MAG: isoleucine--tRNA ligase [Pseudomonadota bacterium]
MSRDYKDTVFLPKSSFSMRANLPKREPEILKHWQETQLFSKMRDLRQKNEKFILHDGPPYANGHIHFGTGMNKVLKDIVNRCQHMLGKQVIYVPGWDCHGLPIEWKIEEKYRKAKKNKDEVSILKFRQECRTFADHWVKIQSEEFQRLGVMGEWETPYTTMVPEAEAQIVEELGKFLLDGSLYRGERPIMWSVVEKTALADAEVEYHDRTSPSIYVRFPIAQTSNPILKDTSIVIWTTTPWTLPGNRAVAYHKEVIYVVATVEAAGENSLAKVGEKLVFAQELIEDMSAATGVKFKILETFPGSQLEETSCRHPLFDKGYDFTVPLLPGKHVTTETGTGFVHTAPGHGQEDFELGREFDLEIPHTLTDDGLFVDSIPEFAGQHVFKVNPKVVESLENVGSLLYHTEIQHSYPHSWRSKAPLIFRTTPQWFISMESQNLRQKTLEAISKIRWFPAKGQRRIESMVQDRPDWCISRQRAWGVPIPVFVNRQTGQPLRDKAIHARIVEAVREKGSDIWFAGDPKAFLAPKYNPEDYDVVKDIVDVWFESGCTHVFVLEKRETLTWPADLYLEGSDQHRGWFQSSLLESCGTRGEAPAQAIFTHGYVLDGQGRKMSKSLGNVVSPIKIADEMGIEMLRLWVVASDCSQDLRLGPEVLKYQQDTYRRLRNTFRYLIGGLSGFTEHERVSYEAMPELERWVLHRLHEMDQLMRDSIENYEFQAFFSALHHFCSVDLSAFYFDVRKDVLYCDAPDNSTRRAMRTVFTHLFDCLVTWLAPVLCFTAEEAWWARYGDKNSSVHLQKFPDISSSWKDEDLSDKFQNLRAIRKTMTEALELARASGKIGSSLQALLEVYDPNETVDYRIDWAEMSIASTVLLKSSSSPEHAYQGSDGKGIGVVVQDARGHKCNRCWKILSEVGLHPIYEDLCQRCLKIVQKSSASFKTVGS